MSVEFDDGTTEETEDWARIMAIVKNRGKGGKKDYKEIPDEPKPVPKEAPKPVAVKQGNVTVKFNKAGRGDHTNYLEHTHRGWTLRVWKIPAHSSYGCNYFKGEEIHYIELPYNSVKDENGVFSYASSLIDEMLD